MPLKNIILTGSIGSIPTHSYGQKMYISSTEQQSFPIERITGSSGGAFPEFNGGYSTTGLFVNVTQSYSESIDTIAGIRTFLHDTQEEFINGEFSGSKLIVADQRLIDEDCVEFLSVNPTLVNYKTYFYYSSASLYNSTPIANFLNSNTSPNDGEIYLYWSYTEKYNNPDVKFNHTISNIKIARKDVQGNDNTLSLQELTNLRLKFSDVSSVTDYPIATITERPSYYLYTLSSLVNVTSSADNNVINHAFSASAFTTPVTVSGNSGAYVFPYTINTDAANYMGVVQYTFGDTPNHTIQYLASAIFTPTTTQPVLFSLQIGDTSLISQSVTISSPIQILLQGTASFIENQSLTLLYYNPDPSNSYTISDVRWSFTQSLNPASPSSTLTVLEPYLLSTFRNTDCDVTMNNVSEQEVSGFYRRVNYNSGATIPTNQQQIISQSAEFADVKDYNYSARAHILPRYNGVRTLQKNENAWSRGDVSFGKTPSVQSLGTYFAYFDWMGGTNPELIDKATAHILYLIDIDGNVLTPSLSSSYYYNLIDNFESNKKANIILNAISGNPLTIGNIPIIRAGAIPMPIIASQTGSLSNPINIQSTMSFGTSGSAVPNYNSLFVNQSSQTIQSITNGNNEILDIPTPIFSSNISLSSNTLTVTKSSNLTKLQIQFTLNDAYIDQIYPGPGYTSFDMEAYVEISTNGGPFVRGLNTIPAVQNVSVTPSTLIFTTPLFTPINTNQYKIVIYNGSGYYDIIIPSSQVKIIQTPQTSIKEVYSGSGGGFFTSSLQSLNVLTGSYSMSLMYNPSNPLTQQNDTPQFSSSGYFPFLPFDIHPGDQIRFEGDENQVYSIISATPQIGFASMSILLDGNVSSGSNLNSFLIRRFQPNPSFITIDSNLNTYTGGGGFILPKFITNEMQKNFDKNVVSLKERGLIT